MIHYLNSTELDSNNILFPQSHDNDTRRNGYINDLAKVRTLVNPFRVPGFKLVNGCIKVTNSD